MLDSDGRTLSYTLHSHDGNYNFFPVGSILLNVSPRDLLKPTFDRLSTWAHITPDEHSSAITKQIIRDQADIGRKLYDELLPPDFKKQYLVVREKYWGGNLLITTDDPWIPWEIVRPSEYDQHGNTLYDDPPLCETFQLARWVKGPAAPLRFSLGSAVVIQPRGDLPAARIEREYFSVLPAVAPGFVVSESLETVEDTLAVFSAGQTQLVHFACHCSFDLTDASNSRLKLTDGFLTPLHLNGDRKAGLLRARPLIFINACHAGERGFGLTRLGGWVESFIAAGASAFIGALWVINDVLAARFAQEFYNRILGLGGQVRLPLAAAFREARLVLRDLNPANPTWLAYALYGEPRALVAEFHETEASPGAILPQVAAEPSLVISTYPLGDRSGALTRWLDHWGFTRDPFYSWDADQEREILPELLVDRPYADRMLGPNISFLLAAPGAGKSAARELVWRECSPERLRVLPIRYTDFGELLNKAGSDPARVTRRNHIEAILRAGFQTLTDSDKVKPTFFKALSPDTCGELLSMAAAFADPLDRARIARWASGSESVTAWDNVSDVRLLGRFAELIRQLGSSGQQPFQSICILVDPVIDTETDALRTQLILKLLVNDSMLFHLPYIAFKFFLPTELGTSLLATVDPRGVRFETVMITWDENPLTGDPFAEQPSTGKRPPLTQMIEHRLRYFSNGSVEDMRQLFTPAAAVQLPELWHACKNSPRKLLQLCNKLLQFHVERTDEPQFGGKTFSESFAMAIRDSECPFQRACNSRF